MSAGVPEEMGMLTGMGGHIKMTRSFKVCIVCLSWGI